MDPVKSVMKVHPLTERNSRERRFRPNWEEEVGRRGGEKKKRKKGEIERRDRENKEKKNMKKSVDRRF